MDSTYWKTELFPVADLIEELATFTRFSERLANEFEREVTLAIFAVRTLIERHTLSEELLAEQIPVQAYPKKTQKPTTWLNNHKINELFDLDSPHRRNLDLLFFCNQIVHSYILLPVREAQRFRHFLFCTDYQRNRLLFLADVEMVVKLLRKVAFDYPAHTHLEFNPKKQDYAIKNYMNADDGALPSAALPHR